MYEYININTYHWYTQFLILLFWNIIQVGFDSLSAAVLWLVFDKIFLKGL